MMRTLSNDLPQRIIPYNLDLRRRELLTEIIVGSGELGFMVLSYRTCVFVPEVRHGGMYKVIRAMSSVRRRVRERKAQA